MNRPPWYDSLPPGWSRYALEWQVGDLVLVTVLASQGVKGPPPLPGRWTRAGEPVRGSGQFIWTLRSLEAARAPLLTPSAG